MRAAVFVSLEHTIFTIAGLLVLSATVASAQSATAAARQEVSTEVDALMALEFRKLLWATRTQLLRPMTPKIQSSWNVRFPGILFTESPTILDGQTFFTEPDAPVYRLKAEECDLYHGEPIFTNPSECGVSGA